MLTDARNNPRLPRLGIDIDGVLAQFDRPFAALLNQILPHHDLPPIDFPVTDVTFPHLWDWDVYYMTRAGISAETQQEILAEAWGAIKASTAFWATLPGYPSTGTDLTYLRACIENGWDLYFITCRPGMTAKFQSEAWLMSKGLKAPFVPTVLICESGEINKPRLCKALGLDALIDDKPSNLRGVPAETRRYLLDRPWNRDVDLLELDALRVHTVADMLQLELERVN